jgi:hypothetical protein
MLAQKLNINSRNQEVSKHTNRHWIVDVTVHRDGDGARMKAPGIGIVVNWCRVLAYLVRRMAVIVGPTRC